MIDPKMLMMPIPAHKQMAMSLASIKGAEERLKKDGGRVNTYVVGGHHPLIRDTWIPQMSESIGLEFILVGHKLPARRATGVIPDCADFIFLMKDMTSHALRGWAKKEAQKLNIPMIETTQKVLNAVEDFKNWSTRMYDIGQELKKTKALKIQEQLDKGIEVIEPKKDTATYLYYDTFKSLVDNNIYSFFPFHSIEEKENKDFWFEKIKENLGTTYTYYVEELIEYMETYLTEIRKKCSLQLKSKWVYAFFDDKQIDVEHTKNQSRVNNSFKSVFNSRLPDELRKEVSEFLHVLHGEDHVPVSTTEQPKEEVVEEATKVIEEQPIVVEEKPIETPKVKVEEPKVVETPKIIEAPKVKVEEPKVIETPKQVPQTEERVVSFSDLNITLKKGSQILLKQVKADKLDLTQSQDLEITIDKLEDGVLYNVLIKY
jgi:predicted DNA-binding protein